MEAPHMSSIRFSVTVITPPQAREWLEKDHRPQRQSAKYIAAYAREMREGRWQLNGETIIISDQGRLLDGRKRLRACVESEASFPCIVVEGVREADFTTIDALRARSAADTLSIAGEQYARRLSAVLNIVFRYYRCYHNPTLTGADVISRETLFVLDLRPEIRDSVEKTLDMRGVPRPNVMAAAHHLMSRVDRERADSFFERVANAETPEDDPAGLLRLQLERSPGSTQERILALTILAWNADHANAPLKTLRWRQEGAHPQKFPTIAGLSADDGADLDEYRQPNYNVTVNPEALTVRIELITPGVAAELRASSSKNRKISGPAVDKYVRDMLGGHWVLNGQTIKISASGKLLDGQHRCNAAEKSGESFHAIVVRGLPDEIFDTLDSGPVRSLGEVLGTRGEKNSNSLAAALHRLWLYESDTPTAETRRGTNAELLGVLERHPQLRQSVHFAVLHLHDLVPSGIAGSTHYLGTQTDREKANYFVERVRDGANLPRYSPILAFRDLMLRDRKEKRNPLRELEKWALNIKALNAFFRGAEVKQLVWRAGAREAFPRILRQLPSLQQDLEFEPAN